MRIKFGSNSVSEVEFIETTPRAIDNKGNKSYFVYLSWQEANSKFYNECHAGLRFNHKSEAEYQLAVELSQELLKEILEKGYLDFSAGRWQQLIEVY